jgi:peptidoglycan/LPS O-acetylase OafA/YrhL
MNYRKDIDGLRTLALIPVILFHAGFESFAGGYVGVDIFFVISGYLITSIILREQSAGTFSLITFYERRARRILPALFLVMSLSLVFAWGLLLPHELKAFGESMIAVVGFASNFLFWQESGYFATESEFIPLLHTWSLAVEEQFYIVFPLLLMLLWRFSKTYLAVVLGIIALLSLGIAEWGWRTFPEANFYLIPSRAWELMIGALVAFFLFYQAQAKGIWAHLGSLVGLALVIYSIIYIDKSLPFPSFYTLAPTIGAALLILFTHKSTLVYQLLSTRLMVGIGLISYSAYLWHFPLLVFAKIYRLDELSLTLAGLLSGLALLLGYLSWRFVERPFRNKQTFNRKQIFTMAGLVGLLLIAIGFALIISNGAEFRYAS